MIFSRRNDNSGPALAFSAIAAVLLSGMLAHGRRMEDEYANYKPHFTEDLHSPEWLQHRGLPGDTRINITAHKQEFASTAIIAYERDPPTIFPEYSHRPWLRARDLSVADMHSAFRRETGLRRIIETYESYIVLRNEGDPLMTEVMSKTTPNASPDCRKRTKHLVGDAWDSITMEDDMDADKSVPLCVQPEDISARFRPVTLDEYLHAKPLPLNQSGARDRYNHGGFPFFDAYGLKKLADFRYETHSFLFGAQVPPNLNRYFGRRFFNRSLIYWPLNGRDLVVLKENLHRFTGPFFLMMSGSDYPEFPKWLLEHPFVLRIFTPNVPRELTKHPKLIGIPLGVRFTTTADTNNQRINAVKIQPREALFASFATHDKHKHGKIRNPSERVRRRRALVKSLQPEWGLNRTEAGMHRSPEEYTEGVLSHKFILSPPGHGLDTYRSWQVLGTGRVPIVKALLPDDLFDNLPVWVVKEWQDVTKAGLEQRWNDMQKLHFNGDKVWHPYWVKHILRECLAAS